MLLLDGKYAILCLMQLPRNYHSHPGFLRRSQTPIEQCSTRVGVLD